MRSLQICCFAINMQSLIGKFCSFGKRSNMVNVGSPYLKVWRRKLLHSTFGYMLFILFRQKAVEKANRFLFTLEERNYTFKKESRNKVCNLKKKSSFSKYLCTLQDFFVCVELMVSRSPFQFSWVITIKNLCYELSKNFSPVT